MLYFLKFGVAICLVAYLKKEPGWLASKGGATFETFKLRLFQLVFLHFIDLVLFYFKFKSSFFCVQLLFFQKPIYTFALYSSATINICNNLCFLSIINYSSSNGLKLFCKFFVKLGPKTVGYFTPSTCQPHKNGSVSLSVLPMSTTSELSAFSSYYFFRTEGLERKLRISFFCSDKLVPQGANGTVLHLLKK